MHFSAKTPTFCRRFDGVSGTTAATQTEQPTARPHSMARKGQALQAHEFYPIFAPPAPAPAAGDRCLSPGCTLIKAIFSCFSPRSPSLYFSSHTPARLFSAVFFLYFHQNESFAHKLLNFVARKGLQFYIIYDIINRNTYYYLTIPPLSNRTGCRRFRKF